MTACNSISTAFFRVATKIQTWGIIQKLANVFEINPVKFGMIHMMQTAILSVWKNLANQTKKVKISDLGFEETDVNRFWL